MTRHDRIPTLVPSFATLAIMATLFGASGLGCTKPPPDGSGGATSATTATASAPGPATSALPSSSAATAGSGAAGSGAAKAASYDGKYTTTAVSAITVPEGTKWKGEEGTEGVGEGKLSLEVGADGRVTGTVEGPLGAALVEGHVEGETLTATFRRKDPADNGFYGTLGGKVAGDKVEGALTASRGNAGLVREGKFSLGKK